MEGKDLDQLFNLGYDRVRDGTHHEFQGEVNIDETDQPCYGTMGLPGKLQPHQQLNKFSEMSGSVWKCLKCLESDNSDK